MKTINAIIIVIMAITAIRIGHDWYVGTPADWLVWTFAIMTCLESVWRSAVRFFGGDA